MSYSHLNFTIFSKQFKKFVRFYFRANSPDPSLRDGSGAIGDLSSVGSVGWCGSDFSPCRLLWPCCMSSGGGGFPFLLECCFSSFCLLSIGWCGSIFTPCCPFWPCCMSVGSSSLPLGSFLSIGWCGSVFAPCCPFWIQLHDFVLVCIWGFGPLTGQIRASGSISLGSEIYKCEKNWWKIYHSLIYLHKQ